MRRRLTDLQIVTRSLASLICGLIGTAIAFVVPISIGQMFCNYLSGPGPDDFDPYRMVGIFIGLALACCIALIGLYHTLRPWIYPYVATKIGHCQRCGYNLRGLPIEQQHCPECGGEIKNYDRSLK